MKFLIDAQLPQALMEALQNKNWDCIHTLDLPLKNRTKDKDISRIADEQNRIVVSKDADFLESLMINGSPNKLLFVSTGNIRNAELTQIFLDNINELEKAIKVSRLVEINRAEIIAY